MLAGLVPGQLVDPQAVNSVSVAVMPSVLIIVCLFVPLFVYYTLECALCQPLCDSYMHAEIPPPNAQRGHCVVGWGRVVTVPNDSNN